VSPSQALFDGSEEVPRVPGLGVIPGMIRRFATPGLSVPQIGWNGILPKKNPRCWLIITAKTVFRPLLPCGRRRRCDDWLLATTCYGGEFVSAVEKGNVTAFQFHPEKSGRAGLAILDNFLRRQEGLAVSGVPSRVAKGGTTSLAKRIIACLDVRSNDAGDLVVTKGDQYDVRDRGEVRNLGKPVDLARRYYEEGADEITFLNITGFRDFPLEDQPMLEVLKRTSENVFVPLTIGGGIRSFTASDGRHYTALDVASEYFRSGADKISIGSDAV